MSAGLSSEALIALAEGNDGEAKARAYLGRYLAEHPEVNLRAELDRLDAEICGRMDTISARRERLRRAIDILREMADWLHHEPRLDRAQSSRAHELIAAVKRGGSVFMYDFHVADPEQRLSEVQTLQCGLSPGHVFIVEHDWAAAFKGAGEYDDTSPFRLPYEHCMFEFSIRGRRVIVDAVENAERYADCDMAVFVELRTSVRVGWLAVDPVDPAYIDMSKLALEQVRAICVSLEAQVAEAEAVRVPDKLRKARERSGKLPPFDHHVVRLHRRVRTARYEGEHVAGARRRLHFRRGHWRHYETHRTWIKWMLVGDPDLGFVDKEYRL